jgi:hypothetical protein
MKKMTFGQLNPKDSFLLEDLPGVFIKLAFSVVPYQSTQRESQGEVLTAIALRGLELVCVSEDAEVSKIL